MPTPISTYPSFLGFAREVTPGTPVAAAVYMPVTNLSTEDVPNYVPDDAMRGSAVAAYNQIPTQKSGTMQCDGPVFLDSIGYIFKGLLGAEDISGTGPYLHKFSVLNSGTYQPPATTLYDYNGYEARQFPYGMFSSCQISFGASALLRHQTQAASFTSAGVVKPSQSFPSTPATAAYKTVVTIGGSATTLVESATVTIARPVNPIFALNNSTSPTAMQAGPVSITGQLTALFTDDTFLTPMLNGSAQSVELSITDASSNILDIKCTNGLFTKAPITRNQGGWMEIQIDFEGVANTTDVTTAGGGFSPGLISLTNSKSVVY